jgi:sRNA-binding protein
MPSVSPSFRPPGNEAVIPSLPPPAPPRDENIIEIKDNDMKRDNQLKQKIKPVNKQNDKGKAKAKDEPSKKGKENRKSSSSSKATGASSGKIRRKSSTASTVVETTEDPEPEKLPIRRPEIDISHLPDGQIGSLMVYKSGKVKLKMGETVMDVSIDGWRVLFTILLNRTY